TDQRPAGWLVQRPAVPTPLTGTSLIPAPGAKVESYTGMEWFSGCGMGRDEIRRGGRWDGRYRAAVVDDALLILGVGDRQPLDARGAAGGFSASGRVRGAANARLPINGHPAPVAMRRSFNRMGPK